MKPAKFLKLAASVLRRLDALLPPEAAEPDWKALAYRWQSIGRRGVLESLPQPHTFPLNRLAAVDMQTARLVRNTEQFLEGRPANNVLMTGARGTGKSSLVKALLHEYADRGLRLIEVDKTDLTSLPALLTLLEKRKEKYIVFCDDLSFESGDDTYKALKTALDGGLSQRCGNVLVYATSNRRHLMPEYSDENLAVTGGRGEVHPQEAVEEKVSLSDRFGLWLSFYPFDQNDYLQAVANWLDDYGLSFDETARQAALNWSLSRGSRSGRVAWQFACDWAGRLPEQRIVD
ncbi:Predicted ATPase (AAA+ superfamily) [Neisseria animaloris]|uniref:ATP-binding protein n=1 Tax=Neisseria animaloris TaxID=326522 RepID=UPI000A192219|nr:ATP-binding protein [Neisseria animaloris]OSI06756.1 AAA family ATPase [Neisseria animaloris]VEH86862.1 Predicted ATPase (AAA+ superfamily) [Neisseria animaloris]